MHTPHPTSRSLSQKVNLNSHRSHLSKKLLLISCSLALLNVCFVGPTSLAQSQRSNDDALPGVIKCNEPLKGNVIHGIRREQAIAIASKHARAKYQSIDQFKIIPCELTTFWRVIFDRGGPEYVIDKNNGLIRRVQLIPESWSPASSTSKNITEEKAVEIAARDAAIPGIDLSTYSLFTVELEKVWRVFVEPKLYYWPGTRRLAIPHSSAPNYVIDKSNGSILRKQRHGSPEIDVSSQVGSKPVTSARDTSTGNAAGYLKRNTHYTNLARVDSQQTPVFDQIPQNSREEFAKRLNLLLDYRRTERWDALYDLISNQSIRGRSRARFVEDYTKYPGVAGTDRKLINFSPKEATRDTFVPGGFIVYGCAQLSGLRFPVDGHILATRENGEWRFSDIAMLVPRDTAYRPCGYLSATLSSATTTTRARSGHSRRRKQCKSS